MLSPRTGFSNTSGFVSENPWLTIKVKFCTQIQIPFIQCCSCVELLWKISNLLEKIYYVLKSPNPSKAYICALNYKHSSIWLITLFLSVILDYLCNPPPLGVTLFGELLLKRFFMQDINKVKAQNELFVV